MIAIDVEMPKNCIECEEKGIRLVNHCTLIFDAKADIERHPNCPLKEIVTYKGCKHRDSEDKFCDCGHTIKWSGTRGDNFYCADGKRRE